MEHLYEKLAKYAEEGNYPYHMPGHKRSGPEGFPADAYRMDITEIEGFDNLHQPEGILKKLQERAAQIYGAEESFYLVGGSTCGVLAAVSSAVPAGGHILMSRNCHKSAYHAVYLRNLKVSYLNPPYLEEYGIADAVTPQQIGEALDKAGDVDAVLIVSPTYEGRISDVAAIAEIVHKKGIPLIVDEAHGAHLGLAEGFAPNSCQAGADLVVHSVHKTLPALTQTALLHVKGRLADRERLRRFLHIYQSSSPSYLLMASIDRALHYVEEAGAEAFARFRKLFGAMTAVLAECRCLNILCGTPETQDVGKLLISVRESRLTGRQLYDRLLQEYHLQTEMAAESFVLAMFTVSDREEAYCRMTEALLEIDCMLIRKKGYEKMSGRPAVEESHGEIGGGLAKGEYYRESGSKLVHEEGYRESVSWSHVTGKLGEAAWRQEGDCIPLAIAWDMDAETVTLEDSVGRRGAEFINLYPPGVPLLVPGEYMTEELCRKIQEAVGQGLTVQGVQTGKDESGSQIILTKILLCKEEGN